MKSSAILSAFVLIVSMTSQGAEIHRIAREGTIFDLNNELDAHGVNLLLLDERDETGLNVWENALLNPQAAQMTAMLEGFLAQEHAAFERGFEELEPVEVAPIEQRHQFMFDEDLRADELYDYFWGVPLQLQARRDNFRVIDRHGYHGPAPHAQIGFSFSPSTSSSQ